MSKKKKARTQIARIHWLDASGYPGWQSTRDIESSRLLHVESVGWLVGEDENVVKLALSRTSHHAGDILVIPKAAVLDRWEL